MVKKIFGYVIALVGVIGLAASTVPQIKSLLPLPETTNTTLLIASLIIAGVGIFLALGKTKGKRHRGGTEVPIYHGKNIVGYRRT